MGRSSFLQSIPINHQESGIDLLPNSSAKLGSGYVYEAPSFDLVHRISSVCMYTVDYTYDFVPVCSMTTPNGRFMTQKKICLSMSDCKFYRCGFKDFFLLL